ncbi:MOXD1 homolog 1-like [Macrobrachium rosenbergii]|uniref:MOXD1 homolog 1-like n=1 Tax=Macrobrachium rosenbergii TaxID=79674 RepID=UPI0034D64114
MPVSWKYCTSILVAWAVGGEGTFTPKHAGFPLGEEHGGATYFMMELHYENPNLRKGIVDNSGLRIYYTENLRPYDAGILMLGHTVSPMQLIPPGQHWLSIGHCSSNCTSNNLPENGINVFAGILHAHLLGRNMTLRHIRDNKELPIIIRDLNFDFNFQETRTLKEELVVLPGDSLITECGLDSTSRNVPTFGGFGSYQEMCQTLLYYYPRVDLVTCGSELSTKSLFYALGIKDTRTQPGQKLGSLNEYGIDLEAETKLAEGLKAGRVESKVQKTGLFNLLHDIIVKTPAKYENRSLFDIVNSAETWKEESVVQRLKAVSVKGEHKQQCGLKTTYRGSRDEVTISYPEFTPLPAPENKMCHGNKMI